MEVHSWDRISLIIRIRDIRSRNRNAGKFSDRMLSLIPMGSIRYPRIKAPSATRLEEHRMTVEIRISKLHAMICITWRENVRNP